MLACADPRPGGASGQSGGRRKVSLSDQKTAPIRPILTFVCGSRLIASLPARPPTVFSPPAGHTYSVYPRVTDRSTFPMVTQAARNWRWLRKPERFPFSSDSLLKTTVKDTRRTLRGNGPLLLRSVGRTSAGFRPDRPSPQRGNLRSINCTPPTPPPPGENKDLRLGAWSARVGLFIRIASGPVTRGSLRGRGSWASLGGGSGYPQNALSSDNAATRLAAKRSCPHCARNGLRLL
jgi:hypothetical protein